MRTRVVRCEQKLSSSNVIQLDEAACLESSSMTTAVGTKPATEWPCSEDPSPPPAVCPSSSDRPDAGGSAGGVSVGAPSIIHAERSNFVQLRSRAVVPLVVGGSATVVVGTSVYVECPVTARNVTRRSIGWHRRDDVGGDLTIDRRRKHRVRTDRDGTLRIRNVRSGSSIATSTGSGNRGGGNTGSRARSGGDDGVYVCTAGGDSASIVIRVQTSDEAAQFAEARHQNLAAAAREADRGDDGDDGVSDQPDAAAAEKVLRIAVDPINKTPEKTSASPTTKTKSKKSTTVAASFSLRYFLGRGPSPDRLPFAYVPASWSPCSAPCGGAGFQSREVVCSLTDDAFVLDVDDFYCNRRGLLKPIADRDCGYNACPHWTTGDWNEVGALPVGSGYSVG